MANAGKIRNSLLGRLGVWLCNRYYPRPCTRSEGASTSQYVRLMIDSLRGQIPHYGRDRKEGQEVLIADRRDYAQIYGKFPREPSSGGSNGAT